MKRDRPRASGLRCLIVLEVDCIVPDVEKPLRFVDIALAEASNLAAAKTGQGAEKYGSPDARVILRSADKRFYLSRA
jgi:hypothetical protein